jgi:hypothetical protein
MHQDQIVATVNIVDVDQEARRIYGDERALSIFGDKLALHDFRFDIEFSDGGKITFAQDATASTVVTRLKQWEETGS